MTPRGDDKYNKEICEEHREQTAKLCEVLNDTECGLSVRVARLETKMENICQTLGEIKAGQQWILSGIAAVLVALAGWGLVQWADKHDAQYRPATQIASQK